MKIMILTDLEGPSGVNGRGSEKPGIERLDGNTLRCSGDDFIDIRAQIPGWAPCVHKKQYGITPKRVHPCARTLNRRRLIHAERKTGTV